jgi:hypothetical protein
LGLVRTIRDIGAIDQAGEAAECRRRESPSRTNDTRFVTKIGGVVIQRMCRQPAAMREFHFGI